MVAALALAGALAGFMIFNFPPASVFMGDEGALAVGLVLGVLSIQGSHFGEGSLPARLAMPLLALMVPLLDTVTVTVTRLATRQSDLATRPRPFASSADSPWHVEQRARRRR